MGQAYEGEFVKEVVTALERGSLRLLNEPVYPYRQVIKGSTSSEADGVIFLETATIILEIEKKGFPSDNVVKYHRALKLSLLKPEIREGRLILVQAFITRNIRPLRVENAKYVGELLKRDYGAAYFSAEDKDGNIPFLVRQFESALLETIKSYPAPRGGEK